MWYELAYRLFSKPWNAVARARSEAWTRVYLLEPVGFDRFFAKLKIKFMDDPRERRLRRADWDRLEPFFTELAEDHQRVVVKK